MESVRNAVRATVRNAVRPRWKLRMQSLTDPQHVEPGSWKHKFHIEGGGGAVLWSVRAQKCRVIYLADPAEARGCSRNTFVTG